MKIIKAELEDGLHAQFKTWAFSRGVTMTDALKSFVGDAVKGVELKIGKVVLGESKPEPKAVGPVVFHEPEKPKVDQKTCKHSYTALQAGGMQCWKCGYKTV